jgi:hypothetical protein
MEIVDSLFHNFYVPPIILAVMWDEEGDEICICVDPDLLRCKALLSTQCLWASIIVHVSCRHLI